MLGAVRTIIPYLDQLLADSFPSEVSQTAALWTLWGENTLLPHSTDLTAGANEEYWAEVVEPTKYACKTGTLKAGTLDVESELRIHGFDELVNVRDLDFGTRPHDMMKLRGLPTKDTNGIPRGSEAYQVALRQWAYGLSPEHIAPVVVERLAVERIKAIIDMWVEKDGSGGISRSPGGSDYEIEGSLRYPPSQMTSWRAIRN